MSEPQAPRPPDDRASPPAPAGDGSPGSAALANLTLGQPVDASDDMPTVVSKGPPVQHAVAPGPAELLNGSLRGRRLAHFELIEAIGVGGMAAVLRARDTQLDRIVALKILPPEMAVEPENVRRFHQEARAAARLDHENIARVFFCGEDQRLHFIAFELVEGENLRMLLERRGRLPVAEAIHYMLQVAAGLDHAAARGVVHRDIKPSNIIISANGRAKLVDMGLARSLGHHGDKGLTQSGVTLGTFDYISPEQALEPRDADVRSDIYSLGCTFYHMLTGQAPVPEGTAAKKLHHHQHIAPLDPRVLNPEIPDIVAAILARMMAKDPKGRYQRPEHLVAHLIQAAQQLGVAPEVPQGGVLFVDTPLPNPPQKRLGLMTALAAGGLGAVLAILAFLPAQPDAVAVPQVKAAADASAKRPNDAAGLEEDGGVAVIPAAGQSVIENEAGLKAALEKAVPPARIVLGSQITLSEGGLKLKGSAEHSLTLESRGPRDFTTIHMSYLSDLDRPRLWAGLIVEGGSVTFKNIVFVLRADETPYSVVAAVAVKAARQVTFYRCAFVQEAPSEPFLLSRRVLPAASIAIDHPEGGDRPRVLLEQCYFARGQTAVAVNGSAEVYPTSCAFGPHGALFHVRGRDKPFNARLTLVSCSAFVVHGPAFRLDDAGSCQVSVKSCIFSCPATGGRSKDHDDPQLVRQTAPAAHCSFTDQRTCYHGLDVYWVVDKERPDLVAEWARFRQLARPVPGPDITSWSWRGQKVPSPWVSDNPLADLRADQPLDRKNQKAFRVNPKEPELRQQRPDGSRPLGVQQCVWGAYHDLDDLPVAMAPGPRPGEKIVDPTAETGGGVYSSLALAVVAAKPGDVILLRHTGALPLQPILLNDPEVILTIRPDKGCRPVLTLAGSTLQIEAALFRLTHGQLKLEGLQVELAPAKEGFRSQSVVAVAGNGQCSFTDCLITLRRASEAALRDVALSVVTLEGADAKMMPMPESRASIPRLHFQSCLVRGEGDLIRAPQLRPVEVKMEQAAVALDGSFLAASGSDAGPADAAVTLELKSVTTYLTGHLVALEDRKLGRGLVPTRVTAHKCLFAAAATGPGKALIHLEGLDGRDQMQRAFAWSGEQNIYSGFDNILDQLPDPVRMADGAPLRLDRRDWGMTFHDNEDSRSRFVQLKLACEPLRDGLLRQLLPLQLRPKAPELPDGCGASLEQLARSLGLLAQEDTEESDLRGRRSEGSEQ
jgi:hypothetical protein